MPSPRKSFKIIVFSILLGIAVGTLAADLLSQSDQTVSTVADQVGYATPYAFKRVRGISPQAHRSSRRQSEAVGTG